jgi:hypothetical protein
MAGSRARAGQLIGQAAPAAKSARARAPAAGSIPAQSHFRSCCAAGARRSAWWRERVRRPAGPYVYLGEYVHNNIYIYIKKM